MEAWNALINGALLGTDKSGDPAAALRGIPALAEVAAVLQDADPETKMLRATALLYNYRRCGIAPGKKPLHWQAAAPEARPYCSAEAGAVLKDILFVGSDGLLQLWLSLCAREGRIAAPDMVTILLEKGVATKAMRSLITACCGMRGAWLCGLNPAWQYGVAGTQEEDRWETGTTAERAALLGEMRAKDPAAARTALAAVWPKEKADVKEALLQAFETSLSEDDLQFLESIQGDKSKKVQAIALQFLLRLPGSILVRRLREALWQSVEIRTEKKLLGMMTKSVLDVRLSKDVDPMLLNAIGKKPAQLSGTSEEDYTLASMIERISPLFWEEYLGLQPQKIVGLFAAAGKDERFVQPLITATVAFKDVRWAQLFADDAYGFNAGIVPLLREKERSTYMLQAAKTAPGELAQYLTRSGIEWPAEIAPHLLRLAAANPYLFPRSFFSSNAHLIPVAIASDPGSYGPQPGSGVGDYNTLYAANLWPQTSDHIRALLVLKTQTIAAFQS